MIIINVSLALFLMNINLNNIIICMAFNFNYELISSHCIRIFEEIPSIYTETTFSFRLSRLNSHFSSKFRLFIINLNSQLVKVNNFPQFSLCFFIFICSWKNVTFFNGIEFKNVKIHFNFLSGEGKVEEKQEERKRILD